MDRITPERRSANMRAIRSKDTAPERAVRSLLHGMGYRYRLHSRGLPGRPDIVFPGRRAVVFVHGCFWHGHDGCRLAAKPKTRDEWWRAKIGTNKERDMRAEAALRHEGWSVRVVWECETVDRQTLGDSLREFLAGCPPRSTPRRRGSRTHG
jgi:DNA mismatch endonuclease (patch repair protein)